MARVSKARRAEIRVAVRTLVAKVLRDTDPAVVTPDDLGLEEEKAYATKYLQELAESIDPITQLKG